MNEFLSALNASFPSPSSPSIMSRYCAWRCHLLRFAYNRLTLHDCINELKCIETSSSGVSRIRTETTTMDRECHCSVYLCFVLFWRREGGNTSLIPCSKFGSLYLGKATAAARVALPIPTSVCSISVCPDNGMAGRVWDFYRFLFVGLLVLTAVESCHGNSAV